MLAPWRIAASETLHPDAEESLRLHLAVARTAGPRRRFNRDWQQVGFDLMPVDVVARYMQRKETGFGDEKHQLYEMAKQPPLSEQIKQRGYEKPVHLVTDGRSGTIYDGHHRIDIARQLGHTHIPVEVSWRSPYEDGSQMYDTKVDPWFKSWLTDMRRGRETVGRRITASELPLFLNEHGEPIGININDGKQDFTGQILRGEKSVETRDSDSLKKYIGKRIGLIRTGLGKAHVVGYATLGEPKFYDNRDDFNADYDLHQVDEGSDYHFDNAKHGIKFGYPLHDVKHEPDPYPVDSLGHRYRPIPRPLTAMPAKDAYDDIVSPYNRSDSQEIHPGPWYHASDHDLPDGTILTPGGGASQWQEEDYYGNERASRKNWVWVNHSPHQTRVWGEHLYQVEPMDEGPWEWNGGGQLFTDGYVSPRARIVRKVPHSELMDQIPDHFKPTKMSNLDETDEERMRRIYEPHPPDDPNLPDSLKPHLMLPTEVAHHYREYDRPRDENTRMLERVIGDQGIRQPLRISTDGSHAMLIEGNHRINVAHRLGISHVPVQVYLEKPGEVMTNSEGSRPVPLEPVLGDWITQNSHRLRSFWH